MEILSDVIALVDRNDGGGTRRVAVPLSCYYFVSFI